MSSKRRPVLIRPPRSLADVNSKNEDLTSLLMLEKCCMYICTGELYMVGYRENDLDDVSDLDGLIASVEPLTFESITHPPRVIQSYILQTCTCPTLSKNDIAVALTCEYSLLLCARGVNLSEFHFSEILESYITEEQAELFSENPSPVAMTIHEKSEILVVITQDRALVVTLNLAFLFENVSYFASEEASRALQQGEDAGAQIDFSKCVRDSFVIDVSEWMLLAPDPTAISSLPSAATAPPMFKAITEHVAVWLWEPLEGGGKRSDHISRCCIVCAGNGTWLEFLPLTRKGTSFAWTQQSDNDPNIGLSIAKENAIKYENEPKTTDHTGWITAICTHEGGMTYACTGDSLGYLCVWEAISMAEQKRISAELYMAMKAKQQAWGEDAKGDEDSKNAGDDNAKEIDLGDGQPSLIGAESVISESERSALKITLQVGFRRKYKIRFSTDYAITCIISIPGNIYSFWVGDHKGILTYISILPGNSTYQTVCTVGILGPESAITSVTWCPSIKPMNDADGRLRFICAASGQIVESNIHGVRNIFNASAGPSFAPTHRSIIEACCVLQEYELLVVGGSSREISVFNLNSGQLECTFTAPDLYCTCIAAFDTGYVPNGVARILVGHSNGRVHSYILSLETTFDEDSAQSETTGPVSVQMDKLGSTSASGSVALSVDILQTLESEANDVALKHDSMAETNYLDATSSYDNLNHVQKSSRENAIGGVYHRKYSIKHEASWSYCPLPVVNIHFSALGLYFAIVFSYQTIVIHDWESDSVHLQIDLDQVLKSVSVLDSYEIEDLHSDGLVLVLHGEQGVRFLDTLNRKFIHEITISTAGINVEACSVWSVAATAPPGSPIGESEGLPNSVRRVFGVFAEKGMRVYALQEDSSMRCVFDGPGTLLPNVDGESTLNSETVLRTHNQLDDIVLGVAGLHETVSPWVPVWGLHRAAMLRYENNEIIKVTELEITNDKCRFLQATLLKVIPNVRANRAVVVVSDGTVVVLHL